MKTTTEELETELVQLVDVRAGSRNRSETREPPDRTSTEQDPAHDGK